MRRRGRHQHPRYRWAALRRRSVGAVLGLLVLTGVVSAAPAPAAVFDLGANVADASNWAGSRGTVGIAVLDRETGQLVENPAAHVQIRSASIVKILVAENLLDRRSRGMALPASDVALLELMVRRSDDAAMSSLYSRYGGLQMVADVARKYGLTEIGAPPTPSYWGMFQITAHDMVRFYDGMLGGGLNAADAGYLVDLMRSATTTGSDGFYQFAGIPDALPGQTWGVKQGWMCCQEGLRRLHTTGLVGPDNRFAIAVLAQYSSGSSWAYGGETLTGVVSRVFPGGVVPASGSSRNPVGSLDAVTEVSPGAVRVNGWTYDPDDPGMALGVHVYVDGQGVGSGVAAEPRPDVARAHPLSGGAHGFTVDVLVADGTHQVCVYALNTGPGTENPALGCRRVTVQRGPVGSVDDVVVSGTRTVTVRGWALDRDAPAVPAAVHVYVDGIPVRGLVADGSRPDLAVPFPQAGAAHGFAAEVPVSGGPHQVCLYGINVDGTPGTNTLLGCRAVAAPTGVLGSLDRAQGATARLVVEGWTLDSSQPAATTAVHVYVDGRAVGVLDAGALRADVGRVYPDAGEVHGFLGSVTVPAGDHQVCVYGIAAQGSSSGNRLLSCRTATVG